MSITGDDVRPTTMMRQPANGTHREYWAIGGLAGDIVSDGVNSRCIALLSRECTPQFTKCGRRRRPRRRGREFERTKTRAGIEVKSRECDVDARHRSMKKRKKKKKFKEATCMRRERFLIFFRRTLTAARKFQELEKSRSREATREKYSRIIRHKS